MSTVYREIPLVAPKMLIMNYGQLKNALIVSFHDYLNISYPLMREFSYEKVTLIAAKDVDIGRVFYVSDEGTITAYSLEDFIEYMEE